MAASSLVVKISADITDFSKQLDKATRGVDQAAKKIENFGKALTVGITAPVLAAAAALGKMAAENEDVAGRMSRVFGDAAASVDASIKQMMASVPETQTDLQRMAIAIDNMAQGMGLAPANAARMSQSLLTLAGDAAAFAHVPMTDALDALERGLAGKTKGLLQFGIAINEADIKQRAYQMGLLHTGNELTETGTALASYSLIMERSSRVQGESSRTADQMGKQFAFLKRDLAELADNVSGLVLPALSDMAKAARDVTAVFAGFDRDTVKVFFEIAAAAAVIAPTVIAIARLVDVVTKIRVAFALLSAGGSIVGFFGALAALPIATIVAGIAAITVALGGLYYVWQKFSGGMPDLTPSTKTLGPMTFRQIGQADTGASVSANQPTERLAGTPLEQFKRQADEITRGFDAAVEHGRPVEAMLGRVNSLHAEAARLLKSQGGAFNETAQAAQDVLDKVQQIKNALDLANASTTEDQQRVLQRIARDQKTGFNAPQQAASDVAKETFDKSRDLELRFAKIQLPKLDTSGFEALVKSLEDTRSHDEALALREALLKLPDGFNAAREASIEFGETQRQYAEDLQKRLLLSQKPSIFDASKEAQVQSNNAVKSFADDIALRQALVKLPDGFNAANLAAVQFAEEQRQTTEDTALAYEKLRLNLDTFGIHLGNLGQGMQMVVLNLTNAAIGFAQNLAAMAGGSGKGAGFGRGLGSLAGMAIGTLFGPGAGTYLGGAIGSVVGTAIGGVVGGLFDHTKDSTNNAADSLDNLAKTADKVSASITNIPQFFKVELERFRAAPITQPPAPPTPPPPPITNPMFGGGKTPTPSPSGTVVPATTINIQTLNVTSTATNAKDLMNDVYQQAAKQKATGSRAPFVFAAQAAFAG